MRVYLAGWQASRGPRERQVIKRSGLKNRCFTFANLKKIPGFPYYIKGYQGTYDACREAKVGIMYDSGVVSFRGYLKKLQSSGADTSKLPTQEQFMELYIAQCQEFKEEWDFYLTLDMEPVAESTLKWHNHLEKRGLRPMPVFHGDVHIDWLKNYVDKGYKYIGLGGSYLMRSSRKRALRQYLDGVFNLGAKYGVEFHGLGITTPWAAMSYPFRSIDSSWWSRSAGYGSIMRWNPTREHMDILHISPQACQGRGKDGAMQLNPSAWRLLAQEIEKEGFDLEILRNDFTERHSYNAIALIQMAKHATERQKTGWVSLV